MLIVVHPHLEDVSRHAHVVAEALHGIFIGLGDPPADRVGEALHLLFLVGRKLGAEPLLLGGQGQGRAGAGIAVVVVVVMVMVMVVVVVVVVGGRLIIVLIFLFLFLFLLLFLFELGEGHDELGVGGDVSRGSDLVVGFGFLADDGADGSEQGLGKSIGSSSDDRGSASAGLLTTSSDEFTPMEVSVAIASSALERFLGSFFPAG
jgi:hypothetical protein